MDIIWHNCYKYKIIGCFVIFENSHHKGRTDCANLTTRVLEIKIQTFN